MGCPAWFLAEKGTYSTERFFGTLAQAAFEIDAMFLYQGGRSYDEHFQLDFATVNIMYRYGVEYDNVVVEVDSEQRANRHVFLAEGIKGLKPGVEYCRFGRIEDVTGSEDLVFHLAWRYLERNPEHRFWVEGFPIAYGPKGMAALKIHHGAGLLYPTWMQDDPSELVEAIKELGIHPDDFDPSRIW
ncbi:MAG: hypothetical protein BLM47_11810 [Candidatus Reconcilbacillus cellulovorans]|uniref:Uncharacterized protein n=1 Tax=Candidatus Reconcilbacillus cellulovorans TaxID=1906605 RepID=A0A2A6DXU4_9BACL|nr:MAG: hypothetical protein BLM47_11810 [Candidatus Reconcilbacillus cellulovorans]